MSKPISSFICDLHQHQQKANAGHRIELVNRGGSQNDPTYSLFKAVIRVRTTPGQIFTCQLRNDERFEYSEEEQRRDTIHGKRLDHPVDDSGHKQSLDELKNLKKFRVEHWKLS